MGINLCLLKKFGKVSAIEKDEFAREYAFKVTGVNVKPGSLPSNINFKTSEFDLICMFDVLEHIENDEKALNSLKPLLKSGGKLIITVPAYQWLFGKHDKIHHHYRRYSKQLLISVASAEKYNIEFVTYFNFFLFPLAVISKVLDKFIKSRKSLGSDQPNSLVNFLFYKIFSLERRMLPHLKFPFGTSLMAILGKQDG